MQIRPATPADLPAIADLVTRVIPQLHAQGNFQWDAHYPRRETFAADIRRKELYVAEIANKVAAFAMMTLRPEPFYSTVGLDAATPSVITHRLAVDPGMRGRGLGIALLNHAERIARQNKIAHLRLDTSADNAVTQKLFPRLGYTFVGETTHDFRPGLRVLVYQKVLPSPELPNPVYAALTGPHRRFSSAHNDAIRYRPDTIPFAGLSSPTTAAFADLKALLAPGESIFITLENEQNLPTGLAGLDPALALPGLQMHFLGLPIDATATDVHLVRLTHADADEMLALKAIAFPGYVGPRFMDLGVFLGIRDPKGRLIAMGGERFAAGNLAEVSAVCTHPDHRGKGYASRLMLAIMREHATRGQGTILHVLADNANAIALYHRLGFEITGRVMFQQLRRPA